MNTSEETQLTIGGNEGFEKGLTIEHVLLSITVVSTKESAGQFDDSCAYRVKEAISQYHDVVRVEAKVLYDHTKIVNHPNECECGVCKPPTPSDAN